MSITPPRRIVDRDDLTLAELIGIKGATGIDPLNPGSVAEGLAVMVWISVRKEGRECDFAELLEIPKATLDGWINDADELAAAEDEAAAAGPTDGSGTRGNASPSPSSTVSPPLTSGSAPLASSPSSAPSTTTA